MIKVKTDRKGGALVSFKGTEKETMDEFGSLAYMLAKNVDHEMILTTVIKAIEEQKGN